jgi:hypothetical protein
LANKPIIWKPLAGLPHIKTVIGMWGGSVSDFDFGRCDGHHEMVDCLQGALAHHAFAAIARFWRMYLRM